MFSHMSRTIIKSDMRRQVKKCFLKKTARWILILVVPVMYLYTNLVKMLSSIEIEKNNP